jgi:hypothetical protein
MTQQDRLAHTRLTVEHQDTTTTRTSVAQKAIDQGTLLLTPDHATEATDASRTPSGIAEARLDVLVGSARWPDGSSSALELCRHHQVSETVVCPLPHDTLEHLSALVADARVERTPSCQTAWMVSSCHSPEAAKAPEPDAVS